MSGGHSRRPSKTSGLSQSLDLTSSFVRSGSTWTTSETGLFPLFLFLLRPPRHGDRTRRARLWTTKSVPTRRIRETSPTRPSNLGPGRFSVTGREGTTLVFRGPGSPSLPYRKERRFVLGSSVRSFCSLFSERLLDTLQLHVPVGPWTPLGVFDSESKE